MNNIASEDITRKHIHLTLIQSCITVCFFERVFLQISRQFF